MINFWEVLKIYFAIYLSRIVPLRIRIHLCRFIYNYNNHKTLGLDWIIDYQPIKDLEKLKILINTKEFCGWNILFLGQYELDTNKVLHDTVKDGMYVVEAGAHIGTETLLLASLVGTKGKVFAFEPNPVVRKRLGINILVNDFSNIVNISEIALGQRPENVSFFIKNESVANQGLSSKYKYDDDVIEITVPQQRLDDWVFINKIPKIDFIKMDVQGSEIDILEGAKSTIQKYRPIILTEAEDSMQSASAWTIEDLFIKIVSLNYSVFLINTDGSLNLLSHSSIRNGNWLAIPL
jgi:FkbM family methyltransferase